MDCRPVVMVRLRPLVWGVSVPRGSWLAAEASQNEAASLALSVPVVHNFSTICKKHTGRALLQVKEQIELNELEMQIFDTLLAARNYHGLATTLRCAGGWVRDKLLGRESHDIDIALDDMTGAEFGNKVREYQESQVRQKLHTV
jgi:Poly A polymerase head domain